MLSLILFFIISSCLSFKIESPSLLKQIEDDANTWFEQNRTKIEFAKDETQELIKIFQAAIARSEATIECQKYLLEHTKTVQDAWRQLNYNRLNPIKLEKSDFIIFQEDPRWLENINNFQLASYEYAQIMNNHKLDILAEALTSARQKNRDIIVRTLKYHTQKRSLFDKLLDQIKDSIPVIKDICGEFGKYLWEKLPYVSLQSFKKIDDEFQKASIYSWDAIILLERQSCKMWNNIDNARACFYAKCLELLMKKNDIVNT